MTGTERNTLQSKDNIAGNAEIQSSVRGQKKEIPQLWRTSA